MPRILYSAAVIASKDKPGDYLPTLLDIGTPLLQGDTVWAVDLTDEQYQELVDKYKGKGPSCSWHSVKQGDIYIHVCNVCGMSIANSEEAPDRPCVGRKPAAPKKPPPGVGSRLKGVLGQLGFKSSKTCGCNKKAAYIDQKGKQWAKENREEIVDMLQEEATKRRLPFSRFAAHQLVRYAIFTAPRTGNP